MQYLLINPIYELHRDEFLHLDQGRHLAWGYISVPPVTSWVSFLIKLSGNGEFWVKFYPALFGALTILLAWKITEALKGNLFALILTSISILLSPLLRINILFQPNSLDIFFWTLVYFSVIKYVITQKIKWIYFTAIAVGFGILSKYNIFFLITGLFVALLFSQHRKLFTSKHFYFATGLCFLIILPNIIWQVNNKFPTYFQLKELGETQLVHVSRTGFLKDQVLYFFNSFFIIVAAFVGFIRYVHFKRFRFLLVGYIITIFLFTILKAKSYYAIGLYPVLIAFGSVYLQSLFQPPKRYFLKIISISIVLIFAIPFLLSSFPVKSPQLITEKGMFINKPGSFKWEDGKPHNLPQDFADMLGWKMITAIVDSAYDVVGEKQNTLVFCANYGQAGAINYYSKFANINAISFNADYINWIPLDQPVRHIILVTEPDESEQIQKLKALFEKVILLGQNNNQYSREYKASIYLLQNAKTNINALIQKAIADYKKNLK